MFAHIESPRHALAWGSDVDAACCAPIRGTILEPCVADQDMSTASACPGALLSTSAITRTCVHIHAYTCTYTMPTYLHTYLKTHKDTNVQTNTGTNRHTECMCICMCVGACQKPWARACLRLRLGCGEAIGIRICMCMCIGCCWLRVDNGQWPRLRGQAMMADGAAARTSDDGRWRCSEGMLGTLSPIGLALRRTGPGLIYG